MDYSGYPDCRPEYIEAFQAMANLATKKGVENPNHPAIEIKAPIISLTKAEIISKGLDLGGNYGQTLSCYDPSPQGQVCGECDSCRIRAEGFASLGANRPSTLGG